MIIETPSISKKSDLEMFSWGISAGGRRNYRNMRFQIFLNFFGVVPLSPIGNDAQIITWFLLRTLL